MPPAVLRPLLSFVAALLLTLGLTTAPAQAGRSHHGCDGPDRIDLPDGWQPEGVTTDGRRLYAGSLATGAILTADPRTGRTRVLPQSATGKPAAGIEYDGRRHVLWVAGGPSGELRAQDTRTGRLLATYSVGTNERFVNDVVVTRRAVYATDSVNQELLVVPLGHGRRLPAARAVTTTPLAGDIVYGEGFNANGIVRVGRWLVVVQSGTGLLFRVDRRTGETTQIDAGGYSFTNGDGLEPGRHGTLYVVRNQDDLVAVAKLSRDVTRARVVDELSGDTDVPTTGALVGTSLWVVNARFGNTTPTTAEYWITRLPTGR